MTHPVSIKLAQREHPAIGVVLLSELVRDLGHDPVPLLQAEGLPTGSDLRPTHIIDASPVGATTSPSSACGGLR
jgi:hypothetical protein